MFTFGASRDVYKKVFMKERPELEKKNPGPGTYPTQSRIGTETPKFSFRIKSKYQKDLFGNPI